MESFLKQFVPKAVVFSLGVGLFTQKRQNSSTDLPSQRSIYSPYCRTLFVMINLITLYRIMLQKYTCLCNQLFALCMYESEHITN